MLCKYNKPKPLSQEIHNHFLSGYMLNLNFVIFHYFSNNQELNPYVFRSESLFIIFGKEDNITISRVVIKFFTNI